MTALEMITTLRLCGNHPSMDGLTCRECPYVEKCDEDAGNARLSLEAADIIEALRKELAAARAGVQTDRARETGGRLPPLQWGGTGGAMRASRPAGTLPAMGRVSAPAEHI